MEGRRSDSLILALQWVYLEISVQFIYSVDELGFHKPI